MVLQKTFLLVFLSFLLFVVGLKSVMPCVYPKCIHTRTWHWFVLSPKRTGIAEPAAMQGSDS